LGPKARVWSVCCRAVSTRRGFGVRPHSTIGNEAEAGTADPARTDTRGRVADSGEGDLSDRAQSAPSRARSRFLESALINTRHPHEAPRIRSRAILSRPPDS